MGIEQEPNILLKSEERMDSLLWQDFKIIQNRKWFCFGVDAVLLADFAVIQPGDCVLDLCTGGGVIPLLLAAKEPTAVITGIELFPEVVEMANRSIRLNQLEDRVTIQTGDICQIGSLVSAQSYHVVTVNPPYRKKETGRLSPVPLVAAAKAEIYCDLSQVVGAIAYSLAAEGWFYLVYPYSRLQELLDVLQRQALQVMQLTQVKNFSEDSPFLCLVGGCRKAQADNGWERIEKKEFVLFQEEGVYTSEMTAIFQKYCVEKK
ncbi:MAG: methyltransferase [Peptococcaceae bacterium]|nr:methyltransferase [Peptococcaceae bacterium]